MVPGAQTRSRHVGHNAGRVPNTLPWIAGIGLFRMLPPILEFARTVSYEPSNLTVRAASKNSNWYLPQGFCKEEEQLVKGA